jgi:hypothetical protein
MSGNAIKAAFDAAGPAVGLLARMLEQRKIAAADLADAASKLRRAVDILDGLVDKSRGRE